MVYKVRFELTCIFQQRLSGRGLEIPLLYLYILNNLQGWIQSPVDAGKLTALLVLIKVRIANLGQQSSKNFLAFRYRRKYA